MNIRYITSVAVAATFLAAAPVLACPEWSASPNYGSVNLAAGFLPDPHTVSLEAGGDQSLAACLGGGFLGYATSAPDYDLYWSGTSGQLTIAVESGIDTVLLVNDPNGNWMFNDDYRTLDAGIVISNPLPGLYNIWVGTYEAGSIPPARLVITEYNY